jgi:hypothetical protein
MPIARSRAAVRCETAEHAAKARDTPTTAVSEMVLAFAHMRKVFRTWQPADNGWRPEGRASASGDLAVQPMGNGLSNLNASGSRW